MSWRLLLLLLLVQPLALRAQESAPANTESTIRALEEQERVAVLVMGSEIITRSAEVAAAQPAVNRRFTHVWRQSNGAWQLVARHANMVAGR